MNKPARMLLWSFATVVISLIAAVLIDPAVLVGVVIGVAMTTLKQIDMGE